MNKWRSEHNDKIKNLCVLSGMEFVKAGLEPTSIPK